MPSKFMCVYYELLLLKNLPKFYVSTDNIYFTLKCQNDLSNRGKAGKINTNRSILPQTNFNSYPFWSWHCCCCCCC